MPKQKKMETWAGIRNNHGGSRNEGKKFPNKNMPAKNESSNAPAIREVEILSEFDIDLDYIPSDFYFSSENKEQFYMDGYDLHEYLPVEDMFPMEYRKVVNGNV